MLKNYNQISNIIHKILYKRETKTTRATETTIETETTRETETTGETNTTRETKTTGQTNRVSPNIKYKSTAA